MRPGVLFIIALVFSLAFITRAVGTASDFQAMAKNAAEHAATDEAAHDGHAEPEPDPAPLSAEGGDLPALVGMIRTRTEEIDRRLAEIEAREKLLLAVEARASEKLAELEAAQRALAETADRLDSASSADIKALADMYANMKPAQAGAIFNAMEPSFAAGFLTQIRPENAALILAAMEPQKAYAVSVIIAGRNAEN